MCTFKENDTRSRLVTVYGQDATSHMLFFARLLQQLGKCVLVVDNTADGEVLNYVGSVPKEEDGRIIYRGITYILNKTAYDEQFFRWYDIVFVNNGIVANPRMDERSDAIYVYTDFSKECRRNMDVAVSIVKPFTMIYTNGVDSCFSQPNYVEFEYPSIKQHMTGQYVLPLSVEDYSCRIHMQYTGKLRYEKLSMEYQELLKIMVCDLFPELKQNWHMGSGGGNRCRAYPAVAGGKQTGF